MLATGIFAMSMFSQGVYGDLADREAALHRPMHDLLLLATQSEEGEDLGSVGWSSLSDLDGVPMGRKLTLEGHSLVNVAAGSNEAQAVQVASCK